MARPAEKARAMMNKWVAMRDGEDKMQHIRNNRNRRPHLASECEHLVDAERYRNQIIREIADKISKIQNPALPEHEIRDLNDSINKLQREKFHWNKRIYQLGGLDYNTIERKRQIEEGDTQSYATYRYYGVAKDLPGVKEHLEKEARARIKVKRSDLYKSITPDYYGWRDEDDGVLLELEAKATEQLIQEHNIVDIHQNILQHDDINSNDDNDDFLSGIHTQAEISKIMLDMKKKALLKKYSL